MTVVICKICNKSFKMITNTHLKSHNITIEGYQEKYGSVVSSEYRELNSKRSSGTNNPMYGRHHADEVKKKISRKLRGRPAHNRNKPMSEEQKRMLRQSAFGRYNNGFVHPNIGVSLSEETRQKISKSIKKYAENNPEKIKTRARKSVQTRIDNGYFEKKKSESFNKKIKRIEGYNFRLVERHINHIVIQCLKCQTSTTYNLFSVHHERMCSTCNPKIGTSEAEQEIYDFISKIFPDLMIVRNDYSILSQLELDIVIPDLKIAIEYNGLYWHSELNGKGKFYHRYKTEKCKENGYFLIQIFEDEWIHHRSKCENRIKSILGMSNCVMARKCCIRKLDTKVARGFLDLVHLQGKGKGGIYYGLYHRSDLVSVMSFSGLNPAKGQKPKDGVYELSRYCSVGTVVGGPSRLLKRFIEDIKPKKIISYADYRWSNGNMYRKIGFDEVGLTVPNYWYIDVDKRIHRYRLRKNDSDDSSLTEWENRQNQGWDRIWDCGSLKFIMTV